jgi:hypothetical protein
MKTHEKRRARAFVGALVADPYRKLAAIVLATGLWFFLNIQITRDLPMPVSLQAIDPGDYRSVGARLAVVLPMDRVVGKRFLAGETMIDQVVITLSGRRYQVDALGAEQLDLRITSFQNLDWTNRDSVEFTAADIQRNLRGLQDVTIHMQPERVRLEVEAIDELPLSLSNAQVDLVVAEDALRSRLRLDTAEYSPERVRILGPASSLAPLRNPAVKPLVARLKGSRNQRQVTTAVELSPTAGANLRLAEACTVTIQVLPVTETFSLELPFRVDDQALDAELQGSYRPVEATKLVNVKAGGELLSTLVAFGEEGADKTKLRTWARQHMRLHVFIPPLEQGLSYGPEIVREARLLLLGPLALTVDPTEYGLAEPVSVTLQAKR